MSIPLDLSGRVALVTGGTQGIGAGITARFVAAGAHVVTWARSAVESPPVGTSHQQVDVRDPEAIESAMAELLAAHGRLDVLVNNAGGAPYAMAADASPRFHDKIIGLNLVGPLALMQAANRAMGERGGAIVNVSSISALRPSPGTAAYGAAKAGIDSLTRSLAAEWAPRVRVNAVNVGLCRTEHTEDHYGGDEQVAKVERTIPMGRMAKPTEVGDVCVYLASDLASYVTGATIACHGGGEIPPFLLIAQETSTTS